MTVEYAPGWRTAPIYRNSALNRGLDISGQLTPARSQQLAELWDNFQPGGWFGPDALSAARMYQRGRSGGMPWNTPAFNWAMSARRYGSGTATSNAPEWFQNMLVANPLVGSLFGRGTGAGQWGISARDTNTGAATDTGTWGNTPTGAGWQGPWGRASTGQFTGYRGEGGVHGGFNTTGGATFQGPTQSEYDERSETNSANYRL